MKLPDGRGWARVVQTQGAQPSVVTPKPLGLDASVSEMGPLRFVARHPERRLERAVILGAGPTGLATAIKLAKMGLQVTVVEKRDPAKQTLPVNLSLRMAFLDRLKELGAFEAVKASISIVDERQVDDDSQPERQVVPLGMPRAASAAFVPGSPHAMMSTAPVAMVRVSDLNEGLYKTARRVGVTFIANATASLTLDNETNFYRVTVKPSSGEQVELGRPDLVIVAEGANSATRDQLGIVLLSGSASQSYVGGSIIGAKRGGNGHAVIMSRIIAKDNPIPLRSLALANPATDRTWLVARVPDNQLAKLTTPEDARAFFQAEALAMLGKKAEELGIDWGGTSVFAVKARIANKAVAGENVLIVGDAARTAHFLSGAGANLGVVDDVHSVEALVSSAREGLLAWKDALKLFDMRVKTAGKLWLASSEKYFTRPPLL